MIGLVVFDIYKNKIKLELNLESFILYLLTPSLLGITSYGVWMGWDTGLYHIPHQLIIRENSIIFGQQILIFGLVGQVLLNISHQFCGFKIISLC